jgi:hypothetical protein
MILLLSLTLTDVILLLGMVTDDTDSGYDGYTNSKLLLVALTLIPDASKTSFSLRVLYCQR